MGKTYSNDCERQVPAVSPRTSTAALRHGRRRGLAQHGNWWDHRRWRQQGKRRRHRGRGPAKQPGGVTGVGAAKQPAAPREVEAARQPAAPRATGGAGGSTGKRPAAASADCSARPAKFATWTQVACNFGDPRGNLRGVKPEVAPGYRPVSAATGRPTANDCHAGLPAASTRQELRRRGAPRMRVSARAGAEMVFQGARPERFPGR